MQGSVHSLKNSNPQPFSHRARTQQIHCRIVPNLGILLTSPGCKKSCTEKKCVDQLGCMIFKRTFHGVLCIDMVFNKKLRHSYVINVQQTPGPELPIPGVPMFDSLGRQDTESRYTKRYKVLHAFSMCVAATSSVQESQP